MLFDSLKNVDVQSLGDEIEKSNVFDDPKMATHLARILKYIKSSEYKNQSLIQVSNIIKQATPKAYQDLLKQQLNQDTTSISQSSVRKQKLQIDCVIKNFQLESQKLEWAGISFHQALKVSISQALINVARQNKAKQVRFWGKILGTQKDYYIIQGVKEPPKYENHTSVGQQKPGEGVNFNSYWVCNDPQTEQKWIQLPNISPQIIKLTRKIKICFSGNLQQNINSYPFFKGTQKHYLKAQLCRMTHALQIVPKGIYKIHDENPKVIEFEEQVKIPQFAQLNSLQSWIHKNQMILNLGRCSHFVDPSLPQDQVQAATSELAEKDPQVERLRGITQDKLPEHLVTLYGGIENIWTIRVQGDNQIFSKDDVNNVYGVTVLKNLYWPGWVTVGYKGGFSSIYIGRAQKSIQTSWSLYENPNLCQEASPTQNLQFSEPNPKQLPKPAQQAKEEQANPPQE